jgi:release factor glutamine methyltransferase
MSAPDRNKRWTVLDLLNSTRDYFEARGIENARLNAELVLAHVLGLERIMLYVRFDQVPDDAIRARLREAVRRRGAHEPLQYIRGTAEFYGRQFEVGPAVLVPRPETELLVELALERTPEPPNARVLEIGAGSGCLAVTLACERPAWRLVATEASPEAAAVARANARRHDVADRCDVRVGSYLEPLDAAGDPTGPFHLVVSNPPYVRTAELDTLQPEVRDYEPRLALDGGPDGLEAYRHILPGAAPRLAPGGHLLVEIAPELAPGIRAIAAGTDRFFEPEFVPDAAGHLRVASLRLRD